MAEALHFTTAFANVRHRSGKNVHTISKKTCLAERSTWNMKELKLDLLPGNLYAAKKRAEQQKDQGKKSCEQKNIVRLVEISAKTEYTDDGENE